MDKKKKRFIFYSSPEHWFQAALDLNEGVIELYNIRNKLHSHQTYHFETKHPVLKSTFSRSIYLLMSYALENLLKGIAVLNNPCLVTMGKLKKEIKTHDLNDLTILNNIELAFHHKEFQGILSDQCIANARYPIGLHQGKELNDPIISEEDYSHYKYLFDFYVARLTTQFYENGWDTGFDDPDLNTKPKKFIYMTQEEFKKGRMLSGKYPNIKLEEE